MSHKPRLGEILLASGALSADKLEEALKAQMIYGGRLGTSLVELGLIDEHELAKVLSEQLHLPVADRDELENVPPRVLELLTAQQAQRLQAIPFRVEGRQAHVAMVDPSPVTVDEVQFTTSMTIRPHVVSEVYLTSLLERYYGIPRPSRYIRLVDDDPMFRGTAVAPAPASEPSPAAPPARAAVPEAWGEPDIAACVRRLLVATGEKDILDAVVEFAAGYFDKMAIFVGKEERFRAVRCEQVAPDPLKALQIPKGQGLFRDVLAAAKPFEGPVPVDLHGLAAAMDEGSQSPLFVSPLFLTKGQGILVGAGFKRTMSDRDVRQFAVLCEKVTVALDILVLRRRLEALPEDLV